MTGTIVESDAGDSVRIGGLGVVFKLSGAETNGALAVIEHPIEPGTLAAPMHTHSKEDELSYVIDGEIGVRIGERETIAHAGHYVFKPRGVPHSFWNAGSHRARLLEIITPAGLEPYFRELAEIVASSPEPDFGAVVQVGMRYGLEMHPESIAEICAKYGVVLGGGDSGRAS